jgi:hypothetical protein
MTQPTSAYNLSVGYLRAFVTLLVLAPASLVLLPRWWQAFPVVDCARWSGFSALVGFNGIFFMSLMFLLSGLFVWKSLARKDAGGFLHGRWDRLGVPFFAAVAVVSPLAYSATHAQISTPVAKVTLIRGHGGADLGSDGRTPAHSRGSARDLRGEKQ